MPNAYDRPYILLEHLIGLADPYQRTDEDEAKINEAEALVAAWRKRVDARPLRALKACAKLQRQAARDYGACNMRTAYLRGHDARHEAAKAAEQDRLAIRYAEIRRDMGIADEVQLFCDLRSAARKRRFGNFGV